MALKPVDPALLALGTDDDPRLGRRVVPVGTAATVALLGCADDTGIANSGGRVGAALGPSEIRRWLYKQTTGMAGELERIAIVDHGDVLPGATLEETHAEVERVVGELSRAGHVVVFLGGGHDLAYASQAGVFEAQRGRGAIANLDTHLDVRPLKNGTIVTSGTPFRRVLERFGERVGSFLELGIQPQHNARAHLAWVKEKRGQVVTLEELRTAPGAGERMKRAFAAALGTADFATVSLDLDVAPAGIAPGTSAPPADGLSAEELARFCENAGKQAKTKLLDVMELSPPHDENGKTARLAALCVWRFLAGVAAR
jgi:formiminoglutamase